MQYHIPRKVRKAFTLLEVVFVIVILGIVASIGSEMIVQTYKTYVSQKAIHNAGFKTELAINQVANRLSYRIDNSVLVRKRGSTGLVHGTDIYQLINYPGDAIAGSEFKILEWIGYDNDGLISGGWSGFADLNASDFTQIISTDSSLNDETGYLHNLDLDGNDPAIMFLGASGIYRNDRSGEDGTYRPSCMYAGGANACMFPVTLSGSATQLQFNGGDRTNGVMQYTEFYQLATSAYAIVPDKDHKINGIDVWDLYLYSNYQPWKGENYKNARSKQLLVKNVSVFRFKQEPNSVRVKICAVEQTDLNETLAICKEKAVIR